ncbi:hypothetical protein [Psychrobacillus sp. FJAT-21963]|nr:hypothetical protein [Psychrobacillus sp. FJAT-21963]
MFNEKSGLVQLWVKNVNDPNSGYTREQVPALSNLREVVFAILDREA